MPNAGQESRHLDRRIAPIKRTVAVALALLAAAPVDVHADFPRLGIFRKKPKENEEPTQKPKQLIETLRTDTDEKKRQAAAVEVRELDPRTNPDLIPGLISVLQRDPSPAVRAEVAQTIGQLKPISSSAGLALEQTYTADPSEQVRKSAQQALWAYHLAGYRPAGTAGAQSQTSEPPLAKPAGKSIISALSAAMPSAIAPKNRPQAGSLTPPSQPPAPVATQSAKAMPVAVTAPAPVAQPLPAALPISRGAIFPQTIEPPLAKSKTNPPAATESVPATPAVVTPPPVADQSRSLVPVQPPPSVPLVPVLTLPQCLRSKSVV